MGDGGPRPRGVVVRPRHVEGRRLWRLGLRRRWRRHAVDDEEDTHIREIE
jgi:hypothetical protein